MHEDRLRVRICIPKTPPDFNSRGAEFDIKLAFCLHHARGVHHAAERQKIKASWCVSGNKTPTVHATGSLLAVRCHCKRRSPVAAPSKTTAPIGIQLWGWMSEGMKGEEKEKKKLCLALLTDEKEAVLEGTGVKGAQRWVREEVWGGFVLYTGYLFITL